MTSVPASSSVAPRRRRSLTAVLVRRPETPALSFLLVLWLVLAFTAQNFWTVGNIQAIFDQVAVVGIIALGVNQVVLAGEIDISVASMLAVSAFFSGTYAMDTPGLIVPLLIALGVGAAIGGLNGSLVVFGRMPSIIVTLGMLNILRGLVFALAPGLVLIPPPATRVLGTGTLFGVSRSLLVLLLVTLIFEAFSRHSTWGRNVLAVGGNRQAALLAGVPVGRVRFIAFVATGLCTGLAAILFLGQIGQVQATAALGLELQVIAAVVVGGTSIAGGRGSNGAALIGALVIGSILNGMTLLRIPSIYQELVLGALILLAVTADTIRRRLLKANR